MSFGSTLNVLALSKTFFFSSPLLVDKRFKHQIKVIVVKHKLKMHCTGDATGKQIHTLSLLAPSLHLMYVRPAKSIAVYAKGGASLTQNGGNGSAGGAVYGLSSTRPQMTHLWMMDRTRLLPLNNPILCSNLNESFFHYIE